MCSIGFCGSLKTVRLLTSVRCFHTKSTIKLGFPCVYDDNDTKKILEALNKNDIEDLYRYNISKQRLKKIEGWRKKFGSFMSLDQVLEVDGFGVTVLRKFYDSIVNPNVPKTVTSKAVKKDIKFITPALASNVIPKIESCVALHVGLDYVTWTKFVIVKDQPTTVTCWNSFEISDRKLHIFELIRNVTQINQLIPDADIYVVENPVIAQNITIGNALQTNINVQKSQLIAMVMLMLNNRKNGDSEMASGNVFFFKQFTSARLFGIYVGNERVSADSVVRSVLECQTRPNEDNIVNIQSKLAVPSGLKIIYEDNNSIAKEYLGQSLLLGLSFLRLCVFKCEDSLKVFNR